MADTRVSPRPSRGPPQSRSTRSVAWRRPSGWLAWNGGTPERRRNLDMPMSTRMQLFNAAGNFPNSHQLPSVKIYIEISGGCLHALMAVRWPPTGDTHELLAAPPGLDAAFATAFDKRKVMDWEAITPFSYSLGITALSPLPLPVLGTCASPVLGP